MALIEKQVCNHGGKACRKTRFSPTTYPLAGGRPTSGLGLGNQTRESSCIVGGQLDFNSCLPSRRLKPGFLASPILETELILRLTPIHQNPLC